MYHLIGIDSPGMQSLAQILFTLGFDVEGSSAEVYSFNDQIKVKKFNANNIKDDMFIVKSDDIPNDNPEVVKANELGLKLYIYPEIAAKISNMFLSIGVAGSHGKTTMSTMMTYLLKQFGGANYLIEDGAGYATKDNKYFVLEASEVNKRFLFYTPDYAIINNIELVHKDDYQNIDELLEAYQNYANNATKMVLARSEDPYTHYIKVNRPIFFYGLDENDDIKAYNVEYSNVGTKFDVEIEGNYYGHFELPIFSKQMLLDTLAVIAIASYERIDAKEVNKVLSDYEDPNNFIVNDYGDIKVVRSYVHHPSEVRMNIRVLEQKYGDMQLVVVTDLEPTDDLKETLKLADVHYPYDIEVDKLKRYKHALIVFLGKPGISDLQKEYEEYLSSNQ